MQLPGRPASAMLQRILAAASLFAMLAWGIAAALTGGDAVSRAPSDAHDFAAGVDVASAGRPAVSQASLELAVGMPTLRPFLGDFDWDGDVSDLVDVGLSPRREPAPEDSGSGSERTAPAQPVGDPTLENPLRVVTAGTIRRGESLAFLLGRQGVGPDRVSVVAREMSPVFNFRHAQPGDRYRLAQDPDGNVIDFRYSTDEDSTLHLYRDGAGYTIEHEATEFIRRVVTIGGLIESTLYTAISMLGEDPMLANDFAALFAWDVDFTRGVRPGDDFKILYERLYRVDADGAEHYVRPGRILASRFRGAAGEFAAVYFEEEDGKGGYFSPDGSSIEREFLISPLEYGRITSNWTKARRHPILNVTRPHEGIDYAAPSGTPVWSVAEGTVIYRGWGGGFGNLVKVRHTNGYVSYYAHLSRFATDLEKGSKVGQKQVIGYVGSSGLSTGPHVCFRIAKDGRYVNPLTLKSPAAKPIPESKWMDFAVVRDTLLSDLDVRRMAAVGEAL